MIDWSNEIIIEGEKTKLIPLKMEHKEELMEAAKDGNLWELWYTSVPSLDGADTYIQSAIDQYNNKSSIPFAVIDKSSNTIIGSTRYCNIDHQNNRLEIGYTWYAKSFQRTGINTECKYLLIKNAFEVFKVIAVEFRTHWHNHPSRKAILRLGAKQDGILRNHKIDKSGNMRDTVVFSIIQNEWQTIKQSLEYHLNKYDKNKS